MANVYTFENPDNQIIVFPIPKKLIFRYFTERPDRPGGVSYAKREVDFIVREALREHYIRMLEEAKKKVHCKDCKHQLKIWHADRRYKNGGYYSYDCKLHEYSGLGKNDDFCSKGELKNET